MKAKLNNGIELEGTVEEIKQFIGSSCPKEKTKKVTVLRIPKKTKRGKHKKGERYSNADKTFSKEDLRKVYVGLVSGTPLSQLSKELNRTKASIYNIMYRIKKKDEKIISKLKT